MWHVGRVVARSRFVSVRMLLRASAIFTGSVAGNRSTLISPAKLDFLFQWQKPGFRAALVGAKVGANVHSHQAMPGDVQPPLPQVNGTPGDMEPRQATEWSCFGSRRPRVRIPPSRQCFTNVLSINLHHGGNRCLSPYVGWRGAVSGHVGSHPAHRPELILRVELRFVRLLRSAKGAAERDR